MKFASLIILYNPSDLELRNTLSHTNVFNKTYVWDNTEKSNESFYKINKTNNDIEYLNTGRNEGLAVPYNTVINKAFKDGMDWLIIFDQDSSISDESLNLMKDYASNCNPKSIAVVAPYVQFSNTNLVDNKNNKSVDWVINSGSMLNLRLIVNNNLYYDKAYFLDRLDADFSKMIVKSGFQIIQVKDSVMKQQLGDARSNHSPLRHYYIFRNRYYFNHKYYCLGKRVILDILQTCHHSLNILLYENNKKEKLAQVYFATRDYLRGNMGRKR